MVAKAKELCQDLVTNVREHYEEFKSRPRYRENNRYGDQGRGDSYGGGRSSYGRQDSNGPSYGQAPGTDSPGAGAAGADYAAQYAQYYGGQDPYAAYGGYAK